MGLVRRRDLDGAVESGVSIPTRILVVKRLRIQLLVSPKHVEQAVVTPVGPNHYLWPRSGLLLVGADLPEYGKAAVEERASLYADHSLTSKSFKLLHHWPEQYVNNNNVNGLRRKYLKCLGGVECIVDAVMMLVRQAFDYDTGIALAVIDQQYVHAY